MKSFIKGKRSSNNSSDSPKRNISRVASQTNGQFESLETIMQSPKRVIKALYDYEPQGPGELGFRKGDFFHVLNGNEEDDVENGWVEATNPITNAKGMVPITYFEVFNRSRPSAASTPSVTSTSTSGSTQRNSNQTLYAVTLYEFKAERDDELDIVPGENLIICAHHDYEWFIAKPINRLGGPGLVPVSYVKIIDLLNPDASRFQDDDLVKIVDAFKIPSVEQWKEQTAKYQASTIPLGTISYQTPINSNSHISDKMSTLSNRSSLGSTNTAILEAGVDSYQLDHGRYQYLVIARLSNGKTRYLYRYYQDFYDLQVKLLELFPYEAGKIENSKRIIPSIPGPLINVNDSISKLRREKLDYYLRNLIGLPSHISRCEEVLKLFEVLDNGFDKEVAEENKKRTSKPISHQSNYHQDRFSQYSGAALASGNNRNSTPTSSDSALNRSRSSSSTNLINSFANSAPLPSENRPKVKAKFYHEEDIFVLLLPSTTRLAELKPKLFKRLDSNETFYGTSKSHDSISLYLKNDYDDFISDNGIVNDDFSANAKLRLKTIEIDDDYKLQSVLHDKCKLVILVN